MSTATSSPSSSTSRRSGVTGKTFFSNPAVNAPHGHFSRYNAGCSCVPCKEARNAYDRDRKRRRKIQGPLMVPTWRASRRIQALMVMGWYARDIEEASGLTFSTIDDLVHDRRETITRNTFDAVCKAYGFLVKRPPQMNAYRKRRIMSAEGYGWVGPWAWENIDDPEEKPSEVASRYVPAWRVRRRMDALSHLGYSTTTIHEATRINRSVLKDIKRGALNNMLLDEFDVFEEFYRSAIRKPAMKGPGASFVQAVAERDGIPRHRDWRDIDNPRERPSGARDEPSPSR